MLLSSRTCIVAATGLLCATAVSAQSLRGADYALLAASTTLLAADWLTTVDFRRSNALETNPILGPRPSIGRVNTYTALSAIANLSVARIAKPSVRRAVWLVVAAVEARAVMHNAAVGYHLNFRI